MARTGPAATVVAASSAAAALALAAVTVGALNVTGATAAPSDNGAAPAGCGSNIHYNAYDAPAGSKHFGPTVTSHDLPVVMEKWAKVCTDPAFMGVVTTFFSTGDAMAADASQSLGAAYVADRGRWSKDVTDMQAKVDHFEVTEVGSGFETLAMVPGSSPSVQPQLIKQSTNEPVGWTLVAHLKDGTTRSFRIECELQPIATKFANVPLTPAPVPTPAPQPSNPPTNPPVVPPSNPPSNPPTHPPTCPCVDPTQVRQPVPSPAQRPFGQSVPTRAPAPQPTQPLPSSTGGSTPAPTPTSSGYNGGGTSNPVVTGTPTTPDTGSHTSSIPPPHW